MRGGKREGSGRKPLPEDLRKQDVHFKVDPWLKAWLLKQPQPQARLFIEALMKAHKLKEPKNDGIKGPPSKTEWLEKPDLPEEDYFHDPTYLDEECTILSYNYIESDEGLRKRVIELYGIEDKNAFGGRN